MANFDTNAWYRLRTSDSGNQCLAGALAGTNGSTAIFFKANGCDVDQNTRWQVFGINSTTYIIRDQASGPNFFLSTYFSTVEETPGKTSVDLRKNNYTDASAFWTVTPWGDGYFFLTNAANGTAWRLKKKPNSIIAMDSNSTGGDHNGQRFSFESMGAINNPAYSTVNLTGVAVAPITSLEAISATSFVAASTTAALSTTAISTALSGPNTQNPSSPGDLSTRGKIAVGISVGGLALLFLTIFGLLFWRKRSPEVRHKRDIPELDEYGTIPAHSAAKYEMYQENASEMPGCPPHYQTAELPDASPLRPVR